MNAMLQTDGSNECWVCFCVFVLFLRHTACAGPQLIPIKAASPVLGRLRQREAARRLMQRDGRPMQRDGRLMQRDGRLMHRDVNAGGVNKSRL